VLTQIHTILSAQKALTGPTNGGGGVKPGPKESAEVKCATGEEVVGGGIAVIVGVGASVSESAPIVENGAPVGWRVTARIFGGEGTLLVIPNKKNTEAKVQAYVICGS
jgi:hypothetical protein